MKVKSSKLYTLSNKIFIEWILMRHSKIQKKEDNLNYHFIHKPAFRRLIPYFIFNKYRYICNL